MKTDALLSTIEETLSSLSVKLTYDDLKKGDVNTHGGMFTLKGEKRIILHKGLSVHERIDILTGILSTLDTEGIHIPPILRKRLEQKGQTL
jgi:hypothetical protein